MVTDAARREAEDFLVELLNTTPVVDGAVRDALGSAEAGEWQRAHGGTGTAEERDRLREARDVLQEVVRGRRAPTCLAPLVEGVAYRPHVTGDGVSWELDVPEARRAAVRAVLAWQDVREDRPGRLRPCANPDCRLFLLDRSKPNRARWCSMAVCGNRMKARRHYQRTREGTTD